MDFVSRVAGPLVNTLNGVGRACLGQADEPTVRVCPSLFEHDPSLILNGKVGVVSLCQTVGGNADQSRWTSMNSGMSSSCSLIVGTPAVVTFV
jgi:hypothetical protein